MVKILCTNHGGESTTNAPAGLQVATLAIDGIVCKKQFERLLAGSSGMGGVRQGICIRDNDDNDE